MLLKDGGRKAPARPREARRAVLCRAARFPRFGSISFFGANSLREGTTSRFSRISQTAVAGPVMDFQVQHDTDARFALNPPHSSYATPAWTSMNDCRPSPPPSTSIDFIFQPHQGAMRPTARARQATCNPPMVHSLCRIRQRWLGSTREVQA